MPNPNPFAPLPYAAAVVAVCLALALKLLLGPMLQVESPFLLFFAAVMFSAWYGGLKPGLLATSLAALISDYLFLSPTGSLLGHTVGQNVRLGLFVFEGILISWLGGARASAGRAVRASERQLRLVTDALPVLISYVDAQGRFRFNNRAYEEWFGRPQAEVYGRQVREVVGRAAHESIREQMERALSGEEVTYEEVLTYKDGRRRHVHATYVPDRGEGGEVRGYVALVQDVTARKEAEEALRQSEQQLSAIFSQVGVGIAQTDLTGRFTLVNGTYCKIAGRPREDLLSLRMQDITHPEDLPQNLALFERLLAEGTDFVIEKRYVLPDGSHVWVSNSVSLLRDGQGAPEAVVAISTDISDRRRAQDALRESVARYRLVGRATNDAIRDWDLLTNEVQWNEALGVLFGYAPEHVAPTAQWWFDHIHPEDRDRVVEGVRAVIEGGGSNWTDEYRYLRADGSYAFVFDRGFVTHDRRGKPARMIGAILDVTGRKQREVQQRFLADASGRLAEALESKAALEDVARLAVPALADLCLFHLLEGEEVQPVAWAHADPDELALLDDVVRFATPRSLESHPVAHALATGCAELVPEVTEKWLQRVAVSPEHLASMRALGFHSLLTVPLVARGRALGALTFCLVEPNRRFEPSNVEVATDLAHRAALAVDNAELYARARRERAEAQSANRMKDEFLATVSHELRTPLNAILGWAWLLRSGKLDEAGSSRGLETIERNAKAQAQLVDDLLDVSRIISGALRLDVRSVELLPVVEAALDTARPAAEAKSIRLQPMLDPRAGPVTGDPARLQQVVWNLLSNAVKFTPRGGRVQVRLARVETQLELAVMDTGQGIAPDFLPYVFDRFRQADGSPARRHSGLGLGLGIVRHLVEMHGGTVHADSPGEGQGATFTVRLPLLIVRPSKEASVPLGVEATDPAQAPKPGQVQLVPCPPALEGLRVLIVEDEPDARELLALVLERCGAEVRAAASAREGLARLEEWRPDVLVSDIGLPGEDGYAFLRAVRARQPRDEARIPALALTAYAKMEDRVRALSAGYQMHVPKPVEPAELAAAVASLAGRTGDDRWDSG